MRFPFARLRERLAARDVLRLRGRFRGRRGLVAFLAVMGPGLIAGIAGNDAGGITTYSVMGATTGLTLLWIFPITIVILAIVQEMAARLGVVTGQGLSDLIRDRFGVRPTAFAMVDPARSPTWPTRSPSSPVRRPPSRSSASRATSRSRSSASPSGRWSSRRATGPSSGSSCRSSSCSWPTSPRRSWPTRTGAPSGGRSSRRTLDLAPAQLLLLLVAVVGTTITPYMQFYLTSAVAEKGIGEDELGLERADAIGGSIWTNVIAIFIVVAAAATIGTAGGDDHLGRGRGAGARARRRPAGRGALRGRAVRRERPGRHDHAALDGVRDLRGVRLGIRGRQALRRRAGVLLDLHVRARRRARWSCCCRASTCCR